MDERYIDLDSLMQRAGMLIAQGKIADYYIVFFNIHNFKYINKVFAYHEGDIVLEMHIKKALSFLTPDERLVRLGGDNFVALVGAANIEEFIEKLSCVQLTYSNGIKEKKFNFGVTAGYACLEGVSQPRGCMAKASVAYQAARSEGAGKIVFLTPEINEKMMRQQSIVTAFPGAIKKGEFLVYYQPKVFVSDQTMYGAEALVRWLRHGEIVPPMNFIPILEADGSICDLDYYVLETVCKHLKGRKENGKDIICVSVNFSRRHMEEDDLVEHIIEIIDKYDIEHQYIEIELTESNDYQDFKKLSDIVSQLRLEGVGTSMDDFGTGFSSLNMIKNVDMNVIKIDKSFIPLGTDYPNRKRDVELFNNIVHLIKQLGKRIVVEGVETKEQLEILKNAGCDIVQGYVFDKPLTVEEFDNRLDEGYTNM